MNTQDKNITIRPMLETDLDAVFAIEQASFSQPWKREDYAAQLADPAALLLVAEADGMILGYLDILFAADEADVANLAVRPDARGAGIGCSLLDAALDMLGKHGTRRLFLEVRESNKKAIRLYRKAGFTRIGRRRAYYTDPTEDALLMRLELPFLS